MNKYRSILLTAVLSAVGCSPTDNKSDSGDLPKLDEPTPNVEIQTESIVLVGGNEDDSLIGGGGHDQLTGGEGADFLDGKGGYDYVRYDNEDLIEGVLVNLLRPEENTGQAKGDQYVSIEGIFGSKFDDDLTGDDKSNDINGLGGDDILNGAGGRDVYNGGPGNDIFVLTAGETDGDVILEFESSDDTKDIIEFRGFGEAPVVTQTKDGEWLIVSESGNFSEIFFVKKQI